MEIATIIALVGIGVLFFLVLFIWFTAASVYKNTKAEIKLLIGAILSFYQKITNIFILYSKYIIERTSELKDKIISELNEWILILNQIIEQAEAIKLRDHILEKLNVNDLDETKKINLELVSDLGYTNNDGRQGILSALNALDDYLYSSNNKNIIKESLLCYQVGTSFAGTLSY